jgi:hypothetical protein
MDPAGVTWYHYLHKQEDQGDVFAYHREEMHHSSIFPLLELAIEHLYNGVVGVKNTKMRRSLAHQYPTTLALQRLVLECPGIC